MVMLKLRDLTAVVRNIIIAERSAIILAALALWPWGVPAMIVAFTLISAFAALCYVWQIARVSTISPSRLLTIYLINFVPAALILLLL